MRDLVRAVLFFTYCGEASLDDLRGSIRSRFDDDLPRNWKVQVRDVLKHDPDIEKTDEGAWLLRSPGATE